MLPQKIVVIGPESTGKSTLCKALAEKLDTVWVAEFAREYLAKQSNAYQFDDLLQIAKGQIDKENEALKKAGRWLICDTDLYVMMVWSHHKYGKVHPWILETIATRKYDAYILCNIDMPWSDDPQREYPDIASRAYFYTIYKEIVSNTACPFIIVSGNEEERIKQALNSGLFEAPKTQN